MNNDEKELLEFMEIIENIDQKFMLSKKKYMGKGISKAVFTQASILCRAGIPIPLAIHYIQFRFLPTGSDDHNVYYQIGLAYGKNRPLFGSERDKYLRKD